MGVQLQAGAEVVTAGSRGARRGARSAPRRASEARLSGPGELPSPRRAGPCGLSAPERTGANGRPGSTSWGSAVRARDRPPPRKPRSRRGFLRSVARVQWVPNRARGNKMATLAPLGHIRARCHGRIGDVSLTSTLFRLARLSATARAASRGPKALGKRAVRIAVGRAWGRSGIPRWPR